MFNQNNKRIFLDYASATPLSSTARKAMEKYWSKDFFNVSAIYAEGDLVKKDLISLRTKVATLLKVGAGNIVFTSGGTESDNLAILGCFEKLKEVVSEPHMIVSALEHPGVLDAAKEVERRGGKVSIVLPDENGMIKSGQVEELLTPRTILVSVGLVNGEIGVIQHIGKIGRLVREYRKKNGSTYPYLHSDASQAVYTDINVEGMNIDLLTLDSGKVYGPKGVGLLVVRPGVSIHPIIFGGGQERGLRSGTESVALIGGFVSALEENFKWKNTEKVRLEELNKLLIKEAKENFLEVYIPGEASPRTPHILSLVFPGKLGEFVAIQLDLLGIMVSTGSACGTGKNDPGMNALRALGKTGLEESAIRISFGKDTKKSDIQSAINALKKIMH